MIGNLNHVGIATPSIEASVAIYRDMLGATSATEKRALPEQGVWVAFVNLPNSQIELIEPYGDASPIHAFLAKNPKGGQHHVCFEVPDIIAARDDLRAKGATILGTGEPRIGAHGVPVIFVHPRDMGGVLIELMAEPQEVSRMTIGSGIAIYLTIWWTALFAILPLGVRSYAEEGIEPVPGGGDPSARRSIPT